MQTRNMRHMPDMCANLYLVCVCLGATGKQRCRKGVVAMHGDLEMPAIRGESLLRPRQLGHIQDKGMGGIFPGMSIDGSDMH